MQCTSGYREFESRPLRHEKNPAIRQGFFVLFVGDSNEREFRPKGVPKQVYLRRLIEPTPSFSVAPKAV